MFSTYQSQDVTILLKDITGLVTPLGTREREARIQSGVHYSEMLPLEYEPSPAYLAAYHDALERYAGITAEAVARAAEQIWESRGRQCALVSLARAGTPIGILIRRYLQGRYGADLPHYTISIIRGRGIDRNAMAYLLDRHAPGDIQFVDGWTGKGAIQRQLDAAMTDYPGVSPGLTVLSDPANVAAICGTHDDFLIASSCLNSTVSGLLSRTFLRGDIIGPGDFHGAAFYRELKDQDLTYQFIDTIQAHFPACADAVPRPGAAAGPDWRRCTGSGRTSASGTSISSSPASGRPPVSCCGGCPGRCWSTASETKPIWGTSTNWPGRRARSWWSIPWRTTGPAA